MSRIRIQALRSIDTIFYILTDKTLNITDTLTFNKELNVINDKVLNFAILITSLFSLPWFIIMLVRIQFIDFETIASIQFFILVLVGTLFLFRDKINFKFRFVLYIVLVSSLTFLFAINVGMLGFWGSGIVLIVTIVSIFYRKSYAFITLGLLFLISGVIAYLFLSNYLTVHFDILTYVNGYVIWMVMLVTFVYVSTITIYTIGLRRSFFVSSIKQLIQEKEKAKKSEQKFKNIFNSSTEGIVISDFEGNILEANKSLLDSTGITKNDIRNKTVRDFVLPEYHSTINERAKSLEQNQALPLLEISIRNIKNEIIPVELNTILIDYNNKKAVFSIIRDITERKKLDQKILSTIIQTEEKERSWLAKELHDGVGPLLSATKIYAKALSSADNEEEKLYTIMKLNETVDEAIISAQEIANNISPHVLRNFGLKGAIESFYQKINKTSSPTFNFQTNLDGRIDENIETTLYRVVVELMHNSFKYANAKLICISLNIDGDKISLNYSDDGDGFDFKKVQEESTSMGLSNIYSRIKSLNGKINMYSEKNKGFKVEIIIDLSYN